MSPLIAPTSSVPAPAPRRPTITRSLLGGDVEVSLPLRHDSQTYTLTAAWNRHERPGALTVLVLPIPAATSGAYEHGAYLQLVHQAAVSCRQCQAVLHGVDAHAALFWGRLAGWLEAYARDYAGAWAEETGDGAVAAVPDLAPAL